MHHAFLPHRLSLGFELDVGLIGRWGSCVEVVVRSGYHGFHY